MKYRELRELAGLGAGDAAQKLEIARNTLWRIEAGRTKKVDVVLVDRMKSLYFPLIKARQVAAAAATATPQAV